MAWASIWPQQTQSSFMTLTGTPTMTSRSVPCRLLCSQLLVLSSPYSYTPPILCPTPHSVKRQPKIGPRAVKGGGEQNGSERAEDVYKSHSSLNGSLDGSHYLWALVVEGGRVKESVTRSTGVPGVEGSLLGMGGRNRDRQRAGHCRNRSAGVAHSLTSGTLTIWGAHTHVCWT